MGDLETLAKARRELQDLYLGVPDDSVNLSFQELAQVTQRKSNAFSSQLSHKKKSPPLAINETTSKVLDKPPTLTKLPSLDFSRALEASSTTRNNLDHGYKVSHHLDHPFHDASMARGSSGHNHHHHHHPLHDDSMPRGSLGLNHHNHHPLHDGSMSRGHSGLHHHHQHQHSLQGDSVPQRSSSLHHHPLHDNIMPRGSSGLHHHHQSQYGHASGEARGDHHAINEHVGQNHIHYGHAGRVHGDDHHAIHGHPGHQSNHHHHQHHVAADRSMGYQDDDISHMSGMTMASMSMATPSQGRRRRRPGIPHSNICTVCTTYIYVFRYRCLVCGRVYCRQCVRIGMQDMAEGRKCIECLGRRFSQRYIHKAGQLGCCMGYPSTSRQQELKWAEKGPSKSGENRPGQSSMVSTSRSVVVVGQRTPTGAHTPSTPPSFVMNSPRSPYTRHHPLPI